VWGVCHKTEKPSVIVLGANSKTGPILRAVSSVGSSNVSGIVKPRTGESENDACNWRCWRNDSHFVGRVRATREWHAGIRGGIGETGAFTNGTIGRWFGGDAGRIDCRNVTLKGLIMRAYGVKEYQNTGPDWLNSDGYDVGYGRVATIPHDAAAARSPQGKWRLAGLCDFLSRTLDHPVKVLRTCPAIPAAQLSSRHCRKGLGLKLEQRKTPAGFLIVDRAERIPVEN
jgi:hypothetical protein